MAYRIGNTGVSAAPTGVHYGGVGVVGYQDPKMAEKSFKKWTGQTGAELDREAAGRSRETQYEQGTNLARETEARTTPYYQQFGAQQEQLRQQAANQATDAKATYQNLSANQLSLMNQAKNNSESAMSLAQFQDINNPVAKQARDFFEQRASGENRRGLADVGVLSALGAQALQGQLGAGNPVTGAQMQLLQSGNQAAAGRAFADVQKRVQQLRDTGYFEGERRSKDAYDAGERAQDRFAGTIGLGANLADRDIAAQQGLRGEQSQYGLGTLGAAVDPIMQSSMSQQALANQYFGGQQAAAEAEAARKAQILPGLIGLGAEGARTYYAKKG